MSDAVEKWKAQCAELDRLNEDGGGNDPEYFSQLCVDHDDLSHNVVEEVLAENERLRADRDKWLSRFTEISEPGSLGAFAARDELRARIETALALHTPFKLTGHEYMGQFCGHCSAETRAPWPCPTVKALRGGDDDK